MRGELSEEDAKREQPNTLSKLLQEISLLLQQQGSSAERLKFENLLVADMPHEPWRPNIIARHVYEEAEQAPNLFDPVTINAEIVESSLKKVKWVKRLTRKGFDLKSADWRGRMSDLIRFHEAFGFYSDFLDIKRAAGVYTGIPRQKMPTEADTSRGNVHMTERLWNLFLTGSWSRGDDISTAEHELIHSQQHNKNGLQAENRMLKVLHTIPAMLALSIVDKLLPNLKIQDTFYGNNALYEAHAFLGSFEPELRHAKNESSTYTESAMVINLLNQR